MKYEPIHNLSYKIIKKLIVFRINNTSTSKIKNFSYFILTDTYKTLNNIYNNGKETN